MLGREMCSRGSPSLRYFCDLVNIEVLMREQLEVEVESPLPSLFTFLSAEPLWEIPQRSGHFPPSAAPLPSIRKHSTLFNEIYARIIPALRLGTVRQIVLLYVHLRGTCLKCSSF